MKMPQIPNFLWSLGLNSTNSQTKLECKSANKTTSNSFKKKKPKPPPPSGRDDLNEKDSCMSVKTRKDNSDFCIKQCPSFHYFLAKPVPGN